METSPAAAPAIPTAEEFLKMMVAATPNAAPGFSSECPCCDDVYEDPRLLSCLHTVCMRCVKDGAVVAEERGEPMRCPVVECNTELTLPNMQPCTKDNIAQLAVNRFCARKADNEKME